ncbi:TonB-dependent receptor [Pseudomonas tolaasii]|uniref:TonB-dependent receptor n=2 Tax=Pseudomonas tolaasii TaxID=29442 RepID=A0A7Y8AJI1_PSETO|nr:TonB-dependent receptor [Pseudomonas tolaasii]ARB27638.1 TonB-dependent siderophore receptor [Pseudomonas tolaasii]KAB0467833.1 TonB-dependent receptor [Pseudomonas tolaasii]MBY8943561.1 TonB-dependent receptor [Pseudomonas tolaasii]NWC19354.1 TonB-dependent receptor [Pseudomonas tolaasii]NWC43129.1 TonB-dependent receptor [Pseudomonas tolaasii]
MTARPLPYCPRPLKALSLAVALAAIAPLHSALAADAAASSSARSYTLAAGPLGNVLAQFAALSGVPLSFDSRLLNDRQSPGLRGDFTAEAGFMQLLQGSGYTLQSTGAGGYTVVPAANDGAVELGATTISGEASGAQADTYGGGQVARSARLGVLGNRSINDVPFSVVSYTAKTIADQQARTVGDVLLNDASVRQSSGFGNFAQMFIIRGLPLNTDDIAFNGLYGVLPRQIITTEALERVELFKGPNAFVNGVSPAGSGIGGSVNLVPKRAEDVPARSVTLDYASDGQTGGHIDLGQRFGEDNRFGARVNLARHGGDTAIDDENKSSQMIAVALDYRGDRLRVSTDVGYQKERINNGRSVVYPNGTQVPKAPSANHNYAQDWSWSELEDTYGMFNAEYDLNEHWTAYVGGGAKHTRENGQYSSLYVGNDGSGRVGFLYSPHDEDNKSAMAGLNGHFTTGPVTHQVNFGLSGIWGEQRSAFEAILQANRVPGNLYNPTQVPRPTVTYFGSDIHDPRIVGKNRIKSAAVSDTLGFIDDRVLLTLGVRRQTIEVDAWNTTTGARNANYAETITTPVYGLVVKPWEHVSFYANRIEGLAQGPTAPLTNVTNPGEVFAPNRSKQTEAGVKLDWDSYGATLGVYRIEQPNSATNRNPNGTNTFSVDGEQVNKGVELNVFGEPVDGLRLLAGATWMDTELKKTSNGLTDGNRAAGVPRFQYNVGADWDVPGIQGAALSARVLRTGGEYVNAANTLNIPAWTRVDLGARYGFKADDKYITLRANVENVANKAYWASASTSNNYLTQGEPRTVKVSATVDF